MDGQRQIFYFWVVGTWFCAFKKKIDSIFNSALGVTYLGNESMIDKLLNTAFP